MRKQQVYAMVRLPDGTIIKQPVSFQGMEKIERRMIRDRESKLWVYKNKYESQDKKNLDRGGK